MSTNLVSKDITKKRRHGLETRWRQVCHFETECTKDFVADCVAKPESSSFNLTERVGVRLFENISA